MRSNKTPRAHRKPVYSTGKCLFFPNFLETGINLCREKNLKKACQYQISDIFCQKLKLFFVLRFLKVVFGRYDKTLPEDCLRPYRVENTGSRPISEVKQRRAWLVLWWVTTWEPQVLLAFALFLFR